MKRVLLLIGLLLFSNCAAFSYSLILPKEKKAIINSKYVFFVGKTNNGDSLYINDQNVYVAPNGAFAYSYKLRDGENRIFLRSSYQRQMFTFYKEHSNVVTKPNLVEFAPQYCYVKNDNTPLRKTPEDFGLNRMSHLFSGTHLVINGEKGDFYRVLLSKKQEAWIQKKYVESEICPQVQPNFVNMDTKTFKNASINTISFTDKLPYTVDDNDREILFRVYNPFVSTDSVYTINIKKPQKYSYSTSLDNGTYTLKVSEMPQVDSDLKDLTIVIDPGHGGSESGAIGCLGDKEKDVNLDIALKLQNLLHSHGANVILTRECDADVSLQDRVNIAKQNDANIFISIHLNSIGDVPMNVKKNSGTSIYYYNRNSKNFAKVLEKNITEVANTKNDGVRAASFAVIRPSDYIGVLVEAAYMTNPIDSTMYTQDKFRQNVAQGILNGILEYVLGVR